VRVVRAKVIDLPAARPSSAHVFLIDTNVWFWTTYTRASGSNGPAPYQVREYPRFLSRARNAKAALRYTPETFAELAHLIEKCEYQLHCVATGGRLKMKDFRNDPALRPGVVKEVQLAHATMTALAQCIPSIRDGALVDAALAELSQHQIDAYDAFAVMSARSERVTAIVTDDGDYATCAGVRVLTANARTLGDARTAGNLEPL
jgi:predicted nucleic acid-binding protein